MLWGLVIWKNLISLYPISLAGLEFCFASKEKNQQKIFCGISVCHLYPKKK